MSSYSPSVQCYQQLTTNIFFPQIGRGPSFLPLFHRLFHPRSSHHSISPLSFDETKRWENAVKSQEAAVADDAVLWVPLFKPIFGWVGRGRPAGSTWIVGRRRRGERQHDFFTLAFFLWWSGDSGERLYYRSPLFARRCILGP